MTHLTIEDRMNNRHRVRLERKRVCFMVLCQVPFVLALVALIVAVR